MRITVGGLLVAIGAGTLVVLGPLNIFDGMSIGENIPGFKASTDWIMGFVKGTPVESPSPDPTAAKESAVEISQAAPTSAPKEEPPPPAAPAVVSAPVVSAPPETPAAAAPPHRRSTRRRAKRAAPTAPAAKAAEVSGEKKLTLRPANAPKKPTGKGDKLIGTYVSLKLKTGREVKGVLQAKTDTQYTLELPGMGPFQYPANNVESIAPAE